ncbi:hypothetical protein WA026_018899 [Henosepilachna vigintioctopunctata]|uniref:Amino acid transporter transmembrane domain-containing protein n=1 Tax=Henosepilachna vigintioctopunctata TaxID=420089 RepID=A0AAW1UG97_9CUCU
MAESSKPAVEIDERTGLKKKPPSGYTMAVMNHMKACIGSGIFALGYAFKNAGMALGPPVLICLALIQLHCQHIVLECGKEVEKHLGRRPDFAETGRGVFEYGPEKFRKYQKCVQIISNVILILCQSGVLCIYIVFFADSMMRVAEHWEYTAMGVQMWVLIAFFPIFISASTLGNLKLVGALSIFINCMLLTGIIITIYLTTTNLPEEFTFEWVGDVTKLPIFISVCLLAFSVIPFVLPLYIESKYPEKIGSPLGVLNVATLNEVWITLLIGVLSYMKYGKDCKGSVTLNLEVGGLSQAVVILVGLSVMLSYTLNIYIVIEALFPLISDKWGPFKYPNLGVFFFRLSYILLTFVLSWSLPLLGQIVALVGAVGHTALTIILPVTFHLAIMWDKSSVIVKVKNFALLLLGVFCLLSGLIAAIQDIVAEIDKVYNPDKEGNPGNK